MFSFNTNLFQFADNIQSFKQGAFDLPTTTHSSPGSMKNKQQKFDDSPFNCSFDEGSQAGHATAVWDASIKYLRSALSQFVDSVKGFNDQNLFNGLNQNQNSSENTLEEMIFKNCNMKVQQKHEFFAELQNSTELMELLTELMKLFNENVFHEITYVVFKIWEKKSETQIVKAKVVAQEEPLIPHFDCFWGYEDEEQPKATWAPFFEQKNMEDVISSADKCTQEIVEDLYFDNRLKLLNLKDSKQQPQNQCDNVMKFKDFFTTLTRSVFLSSEGFYNQPLSDQKSTKMCEEFNDDFEFEFNNVCALDEMKLNQKSFIRSFSQAFEDDEDDFQFSQNPTKKRKSQ